MNYRLVRLPDGPRPNADEDYLFNADLHCFCDLPESACARRYFLIERMPEPMEIYEHDYYHR